MHTRARTLRGISLVTASQAIGVLTSLVLAGADADPITITFLRFAFGALLLAVTIPTVIRLPRRAWTAAIVYGADVALYILALQYAPIGVVLAITATAPLIAATLERARGTTRLTRWGSTAVTAATIGAALAAAGTPMNGATITGIALAVASVIACASGTVLLGEHAHESSWALTQAVNLAGVLLMLPAVAVVGLHPSLPAAGAALTAAIAGGGLAAVAFLRALRLLPASIAMAIATIGLPAGAIAGWVLLNQPISGTSAAGYSLVIAATLIAATRPVNRDHSHP